MTVIVTVSVTVSETVFCEIGVPKRESTMPVLTCSEHRILTPKSNPHPKGMWTILRACVSHAGSVGASEHNCSEVSTGDPHPYNLAQKNEFMNGDDVI